MCPLFLIYKQLLQGSGCITQHLPLSCQLPMVKLLGASASFVGTLNSGHTPEIISLNTLLMSHQSGILFLLWPWLTQARDADVI